MFLVVFSDIFQIFHEFIAVEPYPERRTVKNTTPSAKNGPKKLSNANEAQTDVQCVTHVETVSTKAPLW